MGGGGVYGGVGEGQGEGGALVPGGPLVHEPGAEGVGGLAEDEVEGAVVQVGEVGGEALGGAEGAADLFDGDVVAALRLDAGADGDSDEALEERGAAVDGVIDLDGMELAVVPLAEVGGGVGGGETLGDGDGEEVVPCGVRFWGASGRGCA